jgi:hypothetical protein
MVMLHLVGNWRGKRNSPLMGVLYRSSAVCVADAMILSLLAGTNPASAISAACHHGSQLNG